MNTKDFLVIIHRVNTSEELAKVPQKYGVEIDIRGFGDQLFLSHDKLKTGEKYTELGEYLQGFNHAFIVFNVKEAGYENQILDLAKRNGIENFFMLDVEFPYLYRATRQEGRRNIAVRYSEAEPIEAVEAQMKDRKPLLDWVWIDTNTQLPLKKDIVKRLKPIKTCLVCPGRWGRPEDIDNYIHKIQELNFGINAVMTSLEYASKWQKLKERK